VQLVVGDVGADLGKLDDLMDARVRVPATQPAVTPTAALRDDCDDLVRLEPLAPVRLVAWLPSAGATRRVLRLPGCTGGIRRRCLRGVLGSLREPSAKLGVLGLELRDALHQPGDLRLEIRNTRVTWIQLRHMELRS
jgi:hypothetical protein